MPKERPEGQRILEDKLFRFLLSSQKKTYKDFYKICCSKSTEAESSAYSYSGFMGWMTIYGMKFCRIPQFLDLLGYRIVVVPKDTILDLRRPGGNIAGTIPAPLPGKTAGIQVAAVDSISKIMSIEQMTSSYRLQIRHRNKKRKGDSNETD